MGTHASEHGAINAQHPRMTSSIAESVNRTDDQMKCLICRSWYCRLLSHRLLTYSILRRVARSEKKKPPLRRKSDEKAESVTRESLRQVNKFYPAVLCAPVTRANGLDHFTSFPVEGVNQSIIQTFHSFFASQGSSLLEGQRNLHFDSGYWPYLYPAACQNPALWHKLRELSMNTCMATELLESQAAKDGRRKSSVPSTYYIYMRGVVAEQGAILHNKLRHMKDLAKYISLTLSIYFVLVLRRSPWKAPLRMLYTELEGILAAFSLKEVNNHTQWKIQYEHEDSGDSCRLEHGLFVWMLLICACAAKICKDQFTLKALGAHVDEVRVLYTKRHNTDWESALVRDLGKLIWSDTFLTGHLRTIWTRHKD